MRGRELLLILLGLVFTTPRVRAESFVTRHHSIESLARQTPAGVTASPTVDAGPVSPARRTLTNLAGVAGTFITLALLGFGLVLFGKTNLEIVSDTASHSFLRSFLVGLLSQILIAPTFGMLVVGLTLSVVGVLLVPFVIAVYCLLTLPAWWADFSPWPMRWERPTPGARWPAAWRALPTASGTC